ncbi:hypothetical protein ACFSCX_02215 [Bacillus salitolerans]|uniref:WYL domain-containing protein n=1 Tax=Bacillus salitolerans TaxID=1437434 RepID=A0ABW4LMT7_9BACI
MNPFYSALNRCFLDQQPVELIYQSISGEMTHRTIMIRKMTPTFIQGYCLLRKTTRTFSLQNILSISTKQKESKRLFYD